ncbi:MAG: TIGR01777 family oxidoreductase [Actinomycetia bacterium]|nr:TIGR01777 family oxidoreductase [Actinomycetes bacterium]
MRIAVTGASGLIGRALVTDLEQDGHEVIRLVRRSTTNPQEIQWDPLGGTVGPGLEGIEAVVHLAGAGVGDHRWTEAYKQEIRDSRVVGTATLTQAMVELADPPKVLVSGSAIGYYGNRGSERLTESSGSGSGFLADVVKGWEAAAVPAAESGIRVVYPRTGLVVSGAGGAFERLFKLFRLGVGGRIGSGNQYWATISLRDEVRALRFLIDHPELSGPVNLTNPNPVPNKVVTKDLATALNRRAFLPVPAAALKAVIGEFASDILSSARVMPAALTSAGFEWLDPTAADAIRTALAEAG